MAALVFLHLFLLHSTGSSNPLGTNSNYDKIPFHPYFTTKDLLGFLIYAFFLMIIRLLTPWVLGDPENFIPANPLVTPVHIQPEWYFLFAYAILRAIPNKLGGVIALFASVLILVPLVLHKPVKFLGLAFYPLSKFFFFRLIRTIFLLSWIGTRPVEDPYILVGQGLTFFYFVYFRAYVKVIGFADNLSN
jgi:ubiquinol-cytochrome c reductase cytochrome b subunit